MSRQRRSRKRIEVAGGRSRSLVILGVGSYPTGWRGKEGSYGGVPCGNKSTALRLKSLIKELNSPEAPAPLQWALQL